MKTVTICHMCHARNDRCGNDMVVHAACATHVAAESPRCGALPDLLGRCH